MTRPITRSHATAAGPAAQPRGGGGDGSHHGGEAGGGREPSLEQRAEGIGYVDGGRPGVGTRAVRAAARAGRATRRRHRRRTEHPRCRPARTASTSPPTRTTTASTRVPATTTPDDPGRQRAQAIEQLAGEGDEGLAPQPLHDEQGEQQHRADDAAAARRWASAPRPSGSCASFVRSRSRAQSGRPLTPTS